MESYDVDVTISCANSGSSWTIFPPQHIQVPKGRKVNFTFSGTGSGKAEITLPADVLESNMRETKVAKQASGGNSPQVATFTVKNQATNFYDNTTGFTISVTECDGPSTTPNPRIRVTAT